MPRSTEYIDMSTLNNQIEVTTSGDDKGVKFKNQVSVSGEIVAGEDSYPVPLAYHCTIVDTTGTTIVNAIDRSSIFQSDSGSYAGLFNGTTAGNYILVGSDIPFEGTKLKYESLATVEPANIIAEYLETLGSGWKETTFMGTNAEGDFEAHGWNIAVHNHTSEHIFMGFNPLTRESTYTWEATTLNINGVDTTKYWARLRITSDITGDPQVQQVKLHTDRIEIESLGIFRYGRSRKKVTILSGISNLITNAQEDPSNRDIKYTDTFTAKTENNRLQANRDDGVAVIANRVSGLDTSIHLIVNISYYVDGTGTGDLELFIRGSQIEDGNIYDGNATTDDYVVYDTITSNVDEVRRTVQAIVPINKLDSISAEFIEISRLGSSSANDTLTSDIVLVSIEVIGYLWKM